MAEYTRRERVIRRVEFHVPTSPPFGAVWAEVMKAIRAAHVELWNAGIVPRDTDAPDDRILLLSGDDDVIVYVEFEDDLHAERAKEGDGP
jgi:hypothetical protein